MIKKNFSVLTLDLNEEVNESDDEEEKKDEKNGVIVPVKKRKIIEKV